ncbi:MAG: hypothetical protein GXY76_00255 [Chloroflexi bacterium]|nr:hypothetical protein [Chloroflexota bacterium]
MEPWQAKLEFDPLPALLSSGDEALAYFVRRDLLGEEVGPVQRLWELPGARRILGRQRPDGSWPGSGAATYPAVHYRLVEAWREFRHLVQVYGLTREHPQTRQAAEFLFSCQTAEGDIRGFLADQYATYYTGAILGLLIQAGYADDPRVERGLEWLLDMRQDDGGWTIPLITRDLDWATVCRLSSERAEPLLPDRGRPFSHNATGMVLRAFAAHPRHRRSEAARVAAELMASRFFQPDAYTSYHAASYWVRFEYPFWWNNLVAALDSLSLIGLPRDHPQMQLAVHWLIKHQEPSGLWRATYAKPEGKETAKTRQTSLWVSLAIGRVLKRLHG